MLRVTMRFEMPVCVNMHHGRALGNKEPANENATMAFKGFALCAHKSDTQTFTPRTDTSQTLAEGGRFGDSPVLDPTVLITHGTIGSSTAKLRAEKDICDVVVSQALPQRVSVELRLPTTVRAGAHVCDSGNVCLSQERNECLDRVCRVSYAVNDSISSRHGCLPIMAATSL